MLWDLGYVVIPVAVLFFVLWKRAIHTWQLKIRGIEDQLGDLEKKKRDIEEDIARQEKRLFLLNKEAEKVVEVFERQGNQTKERILSLAAEAAEAIETQAREQIHQILEEEKGNLKNKILGNGQLIDEKVAGNCCQREPSDYAEK